MLAALALLGSLHLARAADFAKDTNYVIRQNASCHASGLFFQRESPSGNSVGSELCFLCFCHSNDTAVCWRRENRICDLNLPDDPGNRILRSRRSMKSFSDVFIRDAAREFFNKQSPEQCKPFESSFSDGCPPGSKIACTVISGADADVWLGIKKAVFDWCTGCTVCECDANGRWDCHILSFCDDKNGKKQMKKRRGHSKNHISKRNSKTSPTTLGPKKHTTIPPNSPAGKRSDGAKMRRNLMKQSSAIKNHKIDEVKSKKINKFASVKKPLPKLQAKKAIPSRNKVTGRPLYINKNLSTKKPINIKSRNDKTVKNNTVEVAQHIVKQFMSTMQKMIKQIDLKTNNTTKQGDNALKKRSMPKQDKNKKDAVKAESKFVPKSTSYVNRKDLGNKNKLKTEISTTSKYGRIKRQVNIVDDAYHKRDSNYVYEWNATTGGNNNLVVNNFTSARFNKPHNFNNNITQPESTENRDKNNHVHLDNKENIVKVALRNFWTINNSSFQYNNLSNKADDVPEINKDHENQIFAPIESHTCKFRTLLQKIIDTDIYLYNNSIKNFENSIKPKRYTILKKIKRLFRNISNKKNRDMLHGSDDLYYSDYDRKQFDYKMSGNCKINTKEKKKLRQSINELKRESEIILKTIGIIKGLLHILDINVNKTQYKSSNEGLGSNENIDKLNIIVKNSYFEELNGKKLTEDQRTQINYIKDNVMVFIKSIGTFARILEDVIQSAVCHNKKKNKTNYANINTYNVINNTTKDYDNTTQTKLHKLKKILLKYNILQNKFIHQIYVILNNLDAKIPNKHILAPQNTSKLHNKPGKEVNRTDAIETNSANIIQNLRKLKLLAEGINDQKRPKRETIDDDDALEYLLILMEYLLKRHGPAYSSANDGLDLLIEAIKSAPDIKLIRKKVLNTVTERRLVTRTTTPVKTFIKYTDYSDTIRKQIKNSSELDKYKMNISNESEDDDDDEDEGKAEEIYNTFKNSKHFSSEQHRDDMSLGHGNTPISNESYYNVKDKGTILKSHNKGNGKLLYNLVRGSSEEEMTTPLSNAVALQSDISAVSPVTDYSNVSNQLKSNSKIGKHLEGSNANIDWIQENFKDIKHSPEKVRELSTPKSVTATRTQKHERNKSDVTDESITMTWKKVDKANEKEIMSKNQMDLLNSLDYVEEEVDSKDDKFSSDTYVLNR